MEQKQKKKRMPPSRHIEAFEAGAVWMITEKEREPWEATKDLEICNDTLNNWLKAVGEQMGQVSRGNREQQHIREPEAEIRSMRKELVEKK